MKKTICGVLKDFGVAHYLHNPNNKRSFYVRVDDTIVWGLGLADVKQALAYKKVT
ncbi:hypothetical protein [Xenorhabdus sp. TH1]|uniref:hypothetical protein n=1 Tax=Xenorhabdus sp. TH1 TaxID=3130166 RepID=UPI0030CD49E8